MTEFKPEPTQNITVGSKKAQLGQSAVGSDNNWLHHSIPLRKKDKKKTRMRRQLGDICKFVTVAIATLGKRKKKTGTYGNSKNTKHSQTACLSPRRPHFR